MTISELLAEIGDDNLIFQNLTQDLAGVQNGKKDSRITFFTDTGKGNDLASAVASGRHPKTTAYIVWMPTDKLQAVLKKAAEEMA
jgi:hypothetical protein